MAKKTKCYLVRLSEFRRISPKCFKAVDFSGHEELIPASQFFGYGDNEKAGESVYLSAWILERKTLQYSEKTPVYLTDDGQNECNVDADAVVYVKHIPKKLEPEIGVEADASLTR